MELQLRFIGIIDFTLHSVIVIDKIIGALFPKLERNIIKDRRLQTPTQ